MTNDRKFPVTLCLTDQEGFDLYRLLTDDRPAADRITDPIPVSQAVIVRLHAALRERSVRNKL